MARSRNIKPGFFQNDLLAEIHPLGRVLFIGLWTLADREGRLEDRPKRIKAQVLPYDECSVEEHLGALAERGFILRYSARGMRLIQVVNWAKHQQPHIKEGPSTLPAPCESDTSTVQEQEENESGMGLKPLIPDSLNPDSRTSTPLPPTSGGKLPMEDVEPEEPKPTRTPKPRKPRGRNFSIASLEMDEATEAQLQRVWKGWPAKGWNFSTRTEAPRRVDYALTAERFQEVLRYCPIEKAEGGRITAQDLAEATLAWVTQRKREAGPGVPPNVPCVANFFSSVEGGKHHWKEALLQHFGAGGEA